MFDSADVLAVRENLSHFRRLILDIGVIIRATEIMIAETREAIRKAEEQIISKTRHDRNTPDTP